MGLDDYTAALKQGKRRYQAALVKGQYPYLPVLDDILSYTGIAQTVNLGVLDIPLFKITGTKTAERTNAFADNFMPLLPPESEFAAKWIRLCEHQIEEGIRDPILVYEFMNRFYVQEGNKRVSVMKYLDAYSIRGNVTRLVPKRTEEKENRIYYEFLDFYELTENYDIWFSREGGYKKLLKYMGRTEGGVWSDEEKALLRSVFDRFTEAFEQAHGEKLEMNASDAFLLYVEIFGYEQIQKESQREMQQGLQKIWEELKLADQGGQVEMVQNPEKEKASLLNRLLPVGAITPEMLKAAFLYPKTPANSSWSYAHELGRLYLEQAFEGKLRTVAYERADTEEEVENAVETAIAEGCNLIFATAPQMVGPCVRCAIKYPKVKIYNCSLRMSYTSICTYYARMHESKFLLGAIAAAVSKDDRLGYVADYPIYGTIANINAFALGARMINPYARVYLEWSKTYGAEAGERLSEEGIGFVSDGDMITPEHASRKYGLYRKKEDGSLENLATPIWHWGKFYERIVRTICQKNSEADVQKGKKAVNYWWGMSADVIDVIYSKALPYGTQKLIEFLKSAIRAGTFRPFDGLLVSQDGSIRCREGECLTPEEIVTMDWLVENVTGRIPESAELTPEARSLVQLQGIKTEEGNDEAKTVSNHDTGGS